MLKDIKTLALLLINSQLFEEHFFNNSKLNCLYLKFKENSQKILFYYRHFKNSWDNFF